MVNANAPHNSMVVGFEGRVGNLTGGRVDRVCTLVWYVVGLMGLVGYAGAVGSQRL